MDTSRIESLREERNTLVERMTALTSDAEERGEDMTEEEATEFDEAEARVKKIDPEIARHETSAQFRPQLEKRDVLVEQTPEQRFAAAKGQNKPEMIYRPNNDNGMFYFRDVVSSQRGDWGAAERLSQQHQVSIDSMNAEQRASYEARAANTTASTAGGGFVPPVFLGEFYAEFAREARPFADVVPNLPLMAAGMTLTIPRITTGTLTADQGATENTAVATQAIVDSPLSVPVRTIAGYNDVSQQLLDRSEPGIDQIIFADLRASYDNVLDTKLLSGTGTNEHLGIRAVSGVNTVAYTDGSPTAAEAVPKLHDAAQKIASNRFRTFTHTVMHPRRSHWLASNLSSAFPLWQQGGYFQAVGSQDGGTIMTWGGRPIVEDANVGVLYGASTTEDEIYLVHAPDLMLWESPTQIRVDPYTVGLNLTVRIVLFGYSAFASARFSKAITVISGTGLIAPTF